MMHAHKLLESEFVGINRFSETIIQITYNSNVLEGYCVRLANLYFGPPGKKIFQNTNYLQIYIYKHLVRIVRNYFICCSLIKSVKSVLMPCNILVNEASLVAEFVFKHTQQ